MLIMKQILLDFSKEYPFIQFQPNSTSKTITVTTATTKPPIPISLSKLDDNINKSAPVYRTSTPIKPSSSSNNQDFSKSMPILDSTSSQEVNPSTLPLRNIPIVSSTSVNVQELMTIYKEKADCITKKLSEDWKSQREIIMNLVNKAIEIYNLEDQFNLYEEHASSLIKHLVQNVKNLKQLIYKGDKFSLTYDNINNFIIQIPFSQMMLDLISTNRAYVDLDKLLMSELANERIDFESYVKKVKTNYEEEFMNKVLMNKLNSMNAHDNDNFNARIDYEANINIGIESNYLIGTKTSSSIEIGADNNTGIEAGSITRIRTNSDIGTRIISSAEPRTINSARVEADNSIRIGTDTNTSIGLGNKSIGTRTDNNQWTELGNNSHRAELGTNTQWTGLGTNSQRTGLGTNDQWTGLGSNSQRTKLGTNSQWTRLDPNSQKAGLGNINSIGTRTGIITITEPETRTCSGTSTSIMSSDSINDSNRTKLIDQDDEALDYPNFSMELSKGLE